MSSLRSRRACGIATCLALCFGGVLEAQEARVGIATGYWHGLLLKADGTIWTWGNGNAGQLGREDDDQWGPVQVPGLSGFRAVAAGRDFSMALKSDGTVWTWGSNKERGLGNGTKTDSPTPTPIAGLPKIVAIAAANRHALALDANGTVWEWGFVINQREILSPSQVAKLKNVTSVATGDEHNVALDSSGQVWVWGDHGAGDLGDGCYNHSAVPQKLRGMTGMKAVGAAHEVTVARKSDGTVWVLGNGVAGQLGNGKVQNVSMDPVMVTGLTGVKALAGGDAHFLALRTDGTVWSWGYNHSHQLGNTRLTCEECPKIARTGALTGIVAIATGENHSVAATAEGGVWAWGDNTSGVLGADPDILDRSDAPMRPGQKVPEKCTSPLFACITESGKVIRICGEQSDSDKWTKIHYRFGPDVGPPDLMYPEDPDKAPPSLFFFQQPTRGEHLITVRFTNGGYTYRVYYGEESGGGVKVEDANGRIISHISCAERPAIYVEYLEMNLPCDPKNPRGAAGCAVKKK